MDPATTSLITQGGPWGLLAVAVGVIAYLYKARENDAREHAREIKELNEARLNDMRELMKIVASFEVGRAALVEGMGLVTATMHQMKDRVFELIVRHGKDLERS